MSNQTNTYNDVDLFKKIDEEWTIFLDRDGVINDELEDGYILNADMFKFLNESLNSFATFKSIFSRIIVVTNQKGIGKGLMTEMDLNQIHDKMINTISLHGGRIDKIYFCSDIDDQSPCRKPNIGMAMQAKKDFPGIQFKKSLMVGNSMSDMEFGKNMGMITIFIKSKKVLPALPNPKIDAVFNNLNELAKTLQNLP